MIFVSLWISIFVVLFISQFFVFVFLWGRVGEGRGLYFFMHLKLREDGGCYFGVLSIIGIVIDY